MRIYIANHVCYVESNRCEDFDLVDKLLTVKNDEDNIYFIKRYMQQKGIKVPNGLGYYKFFNRATKSFPVGMLPVVMTLKDFVPIDVVDMRPEITVGTHNVPLRDYQVDILNRIFENKVGIVQAPTGSGKSLCIVALFQSLDNHTRLYVSHRVSLVAQMKDFLIRFGTDKEKIKIFGHDEVNFEEKPIVLSTFQTLWNRRETDKVQDLLMETEVLCADEVHVVPADTFFRLLRKCQALYRIGFSATPFTDSIARNAKVVAVVGPIIYRHDSKDLIKKQFLAEPHIYFIHINSHTQETYDTYTELYSDLIVMNKHRNDIVHKIASISNAHGLNVLILVRSLLHVEELKSRYGYEALQGCDSVESRRRVLEKFEKSRGNTLIATTIFDEGIDIHNVHVIIVASGGKSYIKTLQRLGRGMRTAEGKRSFLFFDFFDETHRLLKRHSRRRYNIYSKYYQVKSINEDDIESVIKNYVSNET